ncbi:MAG: ABC transporter permease [Tannerellaceae bacterium]|jgi:putative ABC transport system permease protein|nr:ABC transporter permease [Tannerellaceae bacterium]
MKTIIISFRSVFRKGRNSFIRILSLSVGLAMALVLVAKVYFESSFDTFTPDIERVYRVQSDYKTIDMDMGFPQTSGGVVVGMKDVMPEVEVGTRFTFLGGDLLFYGEDMKRYAADIIIADSSLFDVFPRPILEGDVREALTRPMYAMVSSEIARNMGGSVVGRTISLEDRPGKVITVGGVFEKIPANAHISYDIVLSLASIGEFMYDGSLNWLGNDRYASYVKLVGGADGESVREGIERVKDKYLDKEQLVKAGVEIGYSLIPLRGLHTSDSDVKQSMWLLGILAFALLFTAVMNYLLIVISSMVKRSKEMAVHKCYGASGGKIYSRLMAETLADLLIALAVSGLLVYVFRGAITSLLGTAAADMFTVKGCLLLAGVCGVVFFVSSLVPGYLYSRVPVAAAFRRFSDGRRAWKLSLLFVQFIAAGFFVTLLAVVGRQYDFMTSDHPGYKTDNLVYFSIPGSSDDDRRSAIDEIARLAGVEKVTSADYILLDGRFSGNNINLPGDERDIFNVADLYSVGDGYLDVMEIPVIEGRSFTEGRGDAREVMVSRSFIEKLGNFVDISSGITGQSIFVSEHSRAADHTFTICGVYEDVRLGVIGQDDERPSVMFYNPGAARNIIVKLDQDTPEAVAKISSLISELAPDKTVNLYSYPGEMVNRYSDSRRFRDSVMIAGLATLLISIMGLLGYTNDEMNRRRKEIAIRKINGASIGGIEKLFLTNIFRLAIPSLALGTAVAWYISEGWMDKFAQKAPLSITLFIVCSASLLTLIMAAVAIKSYRAATENPSLNIKSE